MSDASSELIAFFTESPHLSPDVHLIDYVDRSRPLAESWQPKLWVGVIDLPPHEFVRFVALLTPEQRRSFHQNDGKTLLDHALHHHQLQWDVFSMKNHEHMLWLEGGCKPNGYHRPHSADELRATLSLMLPSIKCLIESGVRQA